MGVPALWHFNEPNGPGQYAHAPICLVHFARRGRYSTSGLGAQAKLGKTAAGPASITTDHGDRLCEAHNVQLQFVRSKGGSRQPAHIKGSDMSLFKVASTAVIFAAISFGTLTDASARGRLYPLTMCGPDLAELCPIHGYFDSAPFHYSLAVYPGCIQVRRVQTPTGVRLARVLVCG